MPKQLRWHQLDGGLAGVQDTAPAVPGSLEDRHPRG